MASTTNQPTTNRVGVVIFVIVTLIALGLGLAALFTSRWIQYDVNKQRLQNSSVIQYENTSYVFHSRSRGLFWIIVDKTAASVIENNGGSPSFVIQYNSNNSCIRLSHGFWSITAMMKSNVGLLLAYLITVGICIWLGALGILWGKTYLQVAVALLILGDVAGLIGMVLFHTYLDLEKSSDGPDTNGLLQKYWPENLKNSTTLSFGYSFFMAWVSIGITLLAIILGAAFAICWRPKRSMKEKDKPEMFDLGNDNLGFDPVKSKGEGERNSVNHRGRPNSWGAEGYDNERQGYSRGRDYRDEPAEHRLNTSNYELYRGNTRDNEQKDYRGYQVRDTPPSRQDRATPPTRQHYHHEPAQYPLRY